MQRCSWVPLTGAKRGNSCDPPTRGAVMSPEFQSGFEPVPGYRLVARMSAPAGVERWQATDPELRSVTMRLVRLGRPLSDTDRFGLQALRQIRHPGIHPLVEVLEVSGLLAL